MKKQVIFFLTIIFVLCFSIPTLAQTLQHDIDVSLSSDFKRVNIGEKVILSAIVPKHGKLVTEKWSGSELIDTKLENDNYVSQSTFSADEPGHYTIEYNIEMKTGQGNVIFIGSKSLTIEVIDYNNVKEINVENIIVSEAKNSKGEIIGYDAIGEVFVEFSNGETLNYGKIFVCFSKDELTKDVNITIDINGEKSTYTVNIQR